MASFFNEIIDTFTKSEELEVFATCWGLEEETYVRDKLFQLKCSELFELINQDIPIPSPESTDSPGIVQQQLSDISNNLTKEQTEQTQQSYPSAPKFFRPWDETSDGENRIPMSSPQPGTSGLQQVGHGIANKQQHNPYTYRMKRQRVFAKNKATDTSYEVKFNDNWKGEKLKEINEQLHEMFDEILDNVRGSPSDLGRVVVHHGGLQNPIVIPLQNWEKLDSNVVLDGITKVLNSNDELIVDDTMSITIGSIAIPQGSGGGKPITSLFGPSCSLTRKRSIFEVINDNNNLCLPIAIGLCYLKTCTKVKAAEWHQLTDQDTNMSTMEKAIKYKTCPFHFYKDMLGRQRRLKMQTNMAETLCRLADVTTDRPLCLNDILPFEQLLDVNVNVVSSKLGNKFVRIVNNAELTNIFIYLVELDDINHFHGIASIAGFFCASSFCETCLKPYSNKANHSCENTCNVCERNDCSTKTPMSCKSCNRECRSKECFDRHKVKKIVHKKPTISLCETRYQCKTCKKLLTYENRDPLNHICGEWKCKTCEQYYVGSHFCFHRAKINEKTDKKFIFYDFETRQDEVAECEEGYLHSLEQGCKRCKEDSGKCSKCRLCQNCHQSWCGLCQHIVNFAVLQSSCTKCENSDLKPDSKCSSCGNRCTKCSKKDKRGMYEYEPCSDTCGFREHIFRGDEAASQFCDYIMSEHCKNSILVAHNAKSFDLYPILEVLIDSHAVRPDKIIYNGTKVMYAHIAKELNLKFVDSLSFIPMKLAEIPKAFGLEELCKGYFPHYFNRKENQRYIGTYPAVQYYGHDYMSTTERENFISWYESQNSEIFNFQQEMLTYCRSDVDILRRGCLRFRNVMMDSTNGVDPFDYITIAGSCMGIFKTLFLEEEHQVEILDLFTNTTLWLPEKYIDGASCVLLNNRWISLTELDKHLKPKSKRFFKSPIGMVPPEGYSKRENYSRSSIQWLEWTMAQTGKCINHALNGGEYKIPGTNFRLDGYEEISKIVYEFQGCVFHGCRKCYPHDRNTTNHPTTNQSMEELYVVTRKRQAYIKSLGYQYIEIWEHEFNKQLEGNARMKTFVDALDIQDRLNPRDSFFGGRTNAIRLHYKVQHSNEKIEYYDFTSLYPWTNKYCKYPVGHPTIITNIQHQNIKQYFGMAKVKILPPRGLYHPILPYTSNGKLKFPLCRTCADSENQDPCICSDDKRAITGTWCTPELLKAVETNYQIIKIYEVYHFEESTQYDRTTRKGGLFAQYVNTFLKIKQEASGWPEGCETEDQKWEYICLYEEKEGIRLDYDKIKKNPGLRSFAKLCLNSFWGKFGQRLGLKQSRFIHESEATEFFQILSDPRKNLHNFFILTPEIVQLEWSDDPMFLPIDTKTNIFIASFTTMWARLKLYSVLEVVGKDCLYMDTDSIIFVDRDGTHVNKLPIGNYLGELTNEISPKEGHIVEYVSSGPKAYSFRTHNGKEVCKIRGFTLNFTNSQLINFDAVKDLVINKKKESITVVNPSKISRDSRKRKLYNRKENKDYTIVYTKRVIKENFCTYPYGY